MAPSRCSMQVRIAFAIIGIIVGVSMFLTAATAYRNWDTSVWGLLSGVFAAVTLGVHIQYNRDEWRINAYRLRPLMLTGCFVQLGAICGFVAYLSIAITEGQDLTPYGPKGYYMTSVWCFMTWKWGFMLFFFARQYKHLYEKTNKISADYKYETIDGSEG